MLEEQIAGWKNDIKEMGQNLKVCMITLWYRSNSKSHAGSWQRPMSRRHKVLLMHWMRSIRNRTQDYNASYRRRSKNSRM